MAEEPLPAPGARPAASPHAQPAASAAVRRAVWVALSRPVGLDVSKLAATRLHVVVPPLRLAVAASEIAAIALIVTTQLEAFERAPATSVGAAAAGRRARGHHRRVPSREGAPGGAGELCVRLHCAGLNVELASRRADCRSLCDERGAAGLLGGRLVLELQRISLRLHATNRLTVRGVAASWLPTTCADMGSCGGVPSDAPAVAADCRRSVARAGRLVSSGQQAAFPCDEPGVSSASDVPLTAVSAPPRRAWDCRSFRSVDDREQRGR